MKRRLKYPLIVEGKYDKATLCSIVEKNILLTDGFRIYKNKQQLSVRFESTSDFLGYYNSAEVVNAPYNSCCFHIY